MTLPSLFFSRIYSILINVKESDRAYVRLTGGDLYTLLKEDALTPSHWKMATTTQVETKAQDATDVMLERAEKAHTKPLWLQMARLNPPLPNPKCTPYLWRYSDIRPSLLEAGELVPEHQAERRVLMLVNPSRGIAPVPILFFPGIQSSGVWGWDVNGHGGKDGV